MGVIKMFNMTEHYEFDDFVVGTAVVCVSIKKKFKKQLRANRK